MRRAARVDENQPMIVKAFRQLGWAVLHIHQLKNCFDILISKNNFVYCVEVKQPGGKLTKGEEEFHKSWNAPVYIIETIDDVLRFSEIHDKVLQYNAPPERGDGD
jgi:Holliday junction resolvase